MVGESIGGEALGLGVGGGVDGEGPGGVFDEIANLESYRLAFAIVRVPNGSKRLGRLGYHMVVPEPLQFHQGLERIFGRTIGSEHIHQLRQDQAIQPRERMVLERGVAVLTLDADDELCHFLCVPFLLWPNRPDCFQQNSTRMC